MKLVSYYQNETEKLGIKLNEGILPVDLMTIHDVINKGESELTKLNELIKKSNSADYITEDLKYAPALTAPEKIICVGLNYKKHADEIKAEYPQYPILFNKYNNALSAHQATVTLPEVTERVDYEAELS